VEALVRIRTLLLPVLVAVLLAVGATTAQAGSFILRLDDANDGVVATEITDQDLLDESTGVDSIVYGAFIERIIGNFKVTVFGAAYNLSPGGPPGGPASGVQMDLSNFLVTSTKGGRFTAELTRTDVPGSLFGPSVLGTSLYGATYHPNDLTGFASVGTVRFQSWVNGQSVLDVSASDSLAPPPPAVVGGPVALSGDFAIVSKLTFDVEAGATLQADTSLQVQNVPEPTTLLLFGPGMLGFAALRRRLRSKAV
jgi:hypothetical protein